MSVIAGLLLGALLIWLSERGRIGWIAIIITACLIIAAFSEVQ